MIPPKVQQVLDEMRAYCGRQMTAIGRTTMNAWADRLQSALEEMQQKRQPLIDAATRRAAKAAKDSCGSMKFSVDAILDLIGQPLNEAKGGNHEPQK